MGGLHDFRLSRRDCGGRDLRQRFGRVRRAFGAAGRLCRRIERHGRFGRRPRRVASVARAEPLDLDEPRPVQHQQSQLQTIGSSIIRLDFVLKAYGPEAEPGRGLLREHVKRIRARLWSNLDERPSIYNAICHADVPEDVDRMIAFFASLRPANDEQRQYLATARDILGAIAKRSMLKIALWPAVTLARAGVAITAGVVCTTFALLPPPPSPYSAWVVALFIGAIPCADRRRSGGHAPAPRPACLSQAGHRGA